MLNKNLDVVSDREYSNIFFIKNYIFFNNDDYMEIRDKNNLFLQRFNSEQVDFFTSVNYLKDDYFVLHGYSNDLIINVKDNTSFCVGKITANVFNDSTSSFVPVFTEGRYFSLKNQEKKFGEKNFQKCYPFINGLAVVLKDDWKKAIIDEKGNLVIDNIINCGWQFKEGVLPVVTEKKSGFINNKGDFVFECSFYDELKNQNVGGNPTLWFVFSEGIAYVQISENSGILLNKKFKIIKDDMPYKVESRQGFSEGVLPVSLNGKVGYINSKGELVIPLIFDFAEDFYNGYACVIYQGKDALLDKKGNIYFCEDLMVGKKIVYKNVIK